MLGQEFDELVDFFGRRVVVRAGAEFAFAYGDDQAMFGLQMPLNLVMVVYVGTECDDRAGFRAFA